MMDFEELVMQAGSFVLLRELGRDLAEFEDEPEPVTNVVAFDAGKAKRRIG